MYNATITLKDKDLIKVLSAEKSWEKDRSSLKFDGNKVLITANDVVAFKATINGLIKLCESYEHTKAVLQ